MDAQLWVIVAMTFVIHLIGTLAYAFRIAGIRSGHIAIAFSLFNVAVLVSRTCNAFQGPLLAKRVETNIAGITAHHLAFDMSIILASASLATIIGGMMIPTVQRLATGAVKSFKRNRSVMRLLLRLLTPRTISLITGSVALPRYQNLTSLRLSGNFPTSVLVLNVLATALWTVGVLAAIYAGAIDPEYRVTASTLSAVINGIATIAMFVLIDPFLAGLTDDVVEGQASEAFYRRVVIWMVIGRLAGTLLAQALLLPGAYLIATVARWI